MANMPQFMTAFRPRTMVSAEADIPCQWRHNHGWIGYLILPAVAHSLMPQFVPAGAHQGGQDGRITEYDDRRPV